MDGDWVSNRRHGVVDEWEDSIRLTGLDDALDSALSTLSPCECRILELRFGLRDGQTCTLEEVGKKFGVSRERIREIERKAIRKLRHPSRSRKLRDYL